MWYEHIATQMLILSCNEMYNKRLRNLFIWEIGYNHLEICLESCCEALSGFPNKITRGADFTWQDKKAADNQKKIDKKQEQEDLRKRFTFERGAGGGYPCEWCGLPHLRVTLHTSYVKQTALP